MAVAALGLDTSRSFSPTVEPGDEDMIAMLNRQQMQLISNQPLSDNRESMQQPNTEQYESNLQLMDLNDVQAAQEAQEAEEEQYQDMSEAEMANELKLKQRAARQQAGTDSAKGELESLATSGIKMGTSRLLELAWLNLIDSFGLTLLWIDAHVCLSLIFGKDVFCRLGEEWSMGTGAAGAIGAAEGKAAAAAAPGKGRGAMLVEAAGVAFLNLLLLVIIIVVIVSVGMILYAITHPGEALWTILKLVFT